MGHFGGPVNQSEPPPNPVAKEWRDKLLGQLTKGASENLTYIHLDLAQMRPMLEGLDWRDVFAAESALE